METNKLPWENGEERTIKHMATKYQTPVGCVLGTWERSLAGEPEAPEPHFTANKRGLRGGSHERRPSFDFLSGKDITSCFRNMNYGTKRKKPGCGLRPLAPGLADGRGFCGAAVERRLGSLGVIQRRHR